MKRRGAWSPALWTGITAFLLALPAFLIQPQLAALPLSIFVLMAFSAPFFPRYSFFLPVHSRGKSGRKAVALTFDDGPDPVTTPLILSLLAPKKIPATFFVVGERARLYPDLIREILAHGHLLGNHTMHHDPLLMLKGQTKIGREIDQARTVLAGFGVDVRAVRPPVGITNPVLKKVLDSRGLLAVNFSCRARDFGNRRLKGLARRILARLKPDDIILLHDVAPAGTGSIELLSAELQALLDGIDQAQLVIRPLDELLGRPIMAGQSAAVFQQSGSEAR